MQRKLLFATALAALVLAPVALAQNPNAGSIFGKPIVIGDADYTPVAKNDAFSPAFLIADFGGGINVRQLCILLMPKQVDTRPVDLPPQVTAFASPALATYTPRPDELRVSEGCPGGVPGSRIGAADAPELRVPFTLLAQAASSAASTVFHPAIQVTDLNNDGKYNAGEPLWLTYDSTNSAYAFTGGAAGSACTSSCPNGLPATAEGTFANVAGNGANTLKFTLRLTSQNGYSAGTFAMSGDADYVQYSTGATTTTNAALGTAGTKVAKDAMGAIERDDKAVFLVTKNSWLAGSAIPSGSIRMGPIGQAFIFPNIQATKITLASSDPVQAGKPFSLVVNLFNGGSGGGPGLLVTRIGTAIVDARLSQPVSAGASDSAVITVTAPALGGNYELKVNDGFLPIKVEGGSASPTDASALQARVDALEAKLDTLQQGSTVKASSGAPGFGPELLVAALLGMGLLLRRRAV